MKKLADLEVYEVLIITLIGLALADLLSSSIKTLFFNTLRFNEKSFKDNMMTFLLPLLILFIIIFITKPPPESLI